MTLGELQRLINKAVDLHSEDIECFVFDSTISDFIPLDEFSITRADEYGTRSSQARFI